MSVQYGAISWNRQKKVYDLTLVSLLALYLAVSGLLHAALGDEHARS